MNREWILFHLREAQEELTCTIQEIEQDLSGIGKDGSGHLPAPAGDCSMA
jgi:hypothetical protein